MGYDVDVGDENERSTTTGLGWRRADESEKSLPRERGFHSRIHTQKSRIVILRREKKAKVKV